MSGPTSASSEGLGTDPGSVWCIVVAGGSGVRFGQPKQFLALGDRRVLDHAVATAAAVCDGIVLVVPEQHVTAEAARERADLRVDVRVVAGGATRSGSVRAGLAAVPDGAGVVLVHDGARPLASLDLYRRVIAAVRAGVTCVVPAIPVVDTLRSLDGGVVDRERIRAVQTPQGFAAAALRAAHRSGSEATDDASLVEMLGHQVVLVEGERSNLKITEPVDLALARTLLAERSATAPQEG